MKAFLKTYWLELAFFAAGLLAALAAWPFLPDSVPCQWRGGEVATTGPKWILLLAPPVQLAVTAAFHWWIRSSLRKFPQTDAALSGMERLLPLLLAVVILTLETCIMLAAWGVPVRLEAVLLIELLIAPLVLLGFAAVKILSGVGRPKK